KDLTLAEYPPAYMDGMTAPPPSYSPPAAKTPAELAQERRLSGSVFSQPPTSSSASGGGLATLASAPAPSSQEGLTRLLQPSSTPAVRARVLATQRLLLPKGAFIDCTLETAIDSGLP